MATTGRRVLVSRGRRVGLGATVVCMVACSSPLEPSACPNPGEFGSSGCTQVVVKVDEPDDVVSGPYALAVSAILDGGEILSHAPEPRFGSFLMLIALNPFSSIRGGDTASVWLRASLVSTQSGMLEDPILAADSVLTSLIFAGVGQVPVLDTIELYPR